MPDLSNIGKRSAFTTLFGKSGRLSCNPYFPQNLHKLQPNTLFGRKDTSNVGFVLPKSVNLYDCLRNSKSSQAHGEQIADAARCINTVQRSELSVVSVFTDTHSDATYLIQVSDNQQNDLLEQSEVQYETFHISMVFRCAADVCRDSLYISWNIADYIIQCRTQRHSCPSVATDSGMTDSADPAVAPPVPAAEEAAVSMVSEDAVASQVRGQGGGGGGGYYFWPRWPVCRYGVDGHGSIAGSG